MATLLQINVCNNVYSTGKIVSGIGETAIRSGWESYIAYGRSFSPSKNKPIKIGSKFDINCHAIENRIFDNAGLGLGSRRATQKLVEEIKRINPDIIHLHVLVGYYINLKVLFDYLRESQISVVWTLHSCWEFTGHCTHFDYQGCSKWLTGCNHCPITKEYPESYIFDRSSINYIEKKNLFTSLPKLQLVAVSEWLNENVKKSFLKDIPCIVINNGVDVGIFKPADATDYLREKYNLSGCFVVLGVASTWTKKKGLEDYLRLSQILPSNIKLVLIGLTKDQINKLPSTIIGVEKTQNLQELIDWYSFATIVLNLSYEESFGLTTIEGYACGTPSIVYDRTASPELIFDGTGYIAKAGDIKHVCQLIKKIIDKGKNSFSRNCREIAEKKFDQSKNYQLYIELYKKILGI